MKTCCMSFSRWFGAFALTAVIGLALTPNLSQAAQGCGFGYHMNLNGRCVPNSPGPSATPVPGNPDCWRNINGYIRCYR